jgi:hypothetical protein
MPGSRRWIALAIMIGVAAVVAARPAQAGAEVKLGKDFLDGVVAKLPPTNFEKDAGSRENFTPRSPARSPIAWPAARRPRKGGGSSVSTSRPE